MARGNSPPRGKPDAGNGNKGFAYFKEKVDIADLLRNQNNQFGSNYFQEHRESTRKHPKFKKYNKEGEHIDTIGIYRKKPKEGSRPFYFVKSWDLGYNDSAMSIYDFLIKELGLEGKSNSLTTVHTLLKEMEINGGFIASEQSGVEEVRFSDNSSAVEQFLKHNTVSNYTDFTYLLSRGISENLLKNINVNSTLRTITHFNKKINQEISNTAFVMKGSKGYTCYSCRNTMTYVPPNLESDGEQEERTRHFKGFPYEVRDSVYFCWLPSSTIGENTRITEDQKVQIAQMIIFESGIDGLSYYDLNSNNCHELDTVIASYEGAKGKSQDKTIRSFIEFYNPDSIGLAFDNDPAGGKYALEFLLNEKFIELAEKQGNLTSESILQDFVISSTISKENAKKYIALEINAKDSKQGSTEQMDSLKFQLDRFLDSINENLTQLQRNMLKVEMLSSNGLNCRVTIEKESAYAVSKIIQRQEFKDNYINFYISDLNDWNEQLQFEKAVLKGTVKEKSINKDL